MKGFLYSSASFRSAISRPNYLHLYEPNLNKTKEEKMFKTLMTSLFILDACPAIYLFKVNNGKTRTMSGICSKVSRKTQEQRPDKVLVSLLLTLNGFYALIWYFHCWIWTSKCRLCVEFLKILYLSVSIFIIIFDNSLESRWNYGWVIKQGPEMFNFLFLVRPNQQNLYKLCEW